MISRPSKSIRSKPKPPDTLWEDLAAVEAEAGYAPKPPGAFTAQEYADRHPGWTYDRSWAHLSRLAHRGIIEMGGHRCRGQRWFRVKAKKVQI